MVAPLSVLPLLFLLVGWFFPFFVQRGKMPPQSLPLVGFLLAAILSAAVAYFISIPPFKSASLFRNEIEAVASLAIGVCFYLVVAVWTRETQRENFLLRLVNWSGALVLVWVFFQAVTWRLFQNFPDWMWDFQEMVSTSRLLYANRANGFAYEPSWLAHQLNMVYLPFWLSATVNGVSAHRLRVWKISLENVLLVGGIVALILSVSRIGLLAFLVMVAYLFLTWNIRLVNWLPGFVLGRLKEGKLQSLLVQRPRLIRRFVIAASLLVVVFVYSGLLAGAAYGLSRYDARMSNLFDISTIKEKSFFHYANQLVFAERIVFWQAGWEVFGDYPILGVGPGNAGFFFAEKLSAFSWALTEVRTLMYQWSTLPNIKSLWVRLLAETGITGFAFFVCWYYLLWRSAIFLRKTKIQETGVLGRELHEKSFQMLGQAGEFVLIALLIEGFSIDTFALPYYWFTFGLLTAMCELARQGKQSELPL